MTNVFITNLALPFIRGIHFIAGLLNWDVAFQN